MSQVQKNDASTILVVEDEPAIRGLISTALQNAGYRVLEARTGQEGLDMFDETVDLLLTDIRLPHIGGQVVIDELLQRRPTLRIIGMSGYPGNEPPMDQQIPFMTKPFSRDELLQKVRSVLDNARVTWMPIPPRLLLPLAHRTFRVGMSGSGGMDPALIAGSSKAGAGCEPNCDVSGGGIRQSG